jgi:hypothetical protein
MAAVPASSAVTIAVALTVFHMQSSPALIWLRPRLRSQAPTFGKCCSFFVVLSK